jgi:hypothetical protein
MFVVACFGDGECRVPPLLEAPVETSDIVVSGSGSSEPFGVDICIDATPSMDGFAAPPDSNYRAFMEDLEGSLASSVKNVRDLRYFKFGESIRQVTREEFRGARNRGFYHEPGIFKATDIELVFRTSGATQPSKRPLLANAVQTPSSRSVSDPRLIVVVTDLFQRDQDVNAVVGQIRTRCLSRPDCSVGLMAIPSQFDGTVHDARVPSYRYRSTASAATFRPFYLLMFGPENELRRFADVLSSRKYIDLNRFTVIGARTVAQFTAAIGLDRPVKGATPRKHCDVPLSAYLNLRKGFDRAAIKTVVRITPDAHAFAANPNRIVVRAYREVKGKLIPADQEVTTTIGLKDGALEIHASIKPPPVKGDHLYVFEAVTGQINGFVVPPWVAGYTSANPRPDRDAAKTLNLDRFVEQLIAASVLDDHHQPKLARFRVLIHKL